MTDAGEPAKTSELLGGGTQRLRSRKGALLFVLPFFLAGIADILVLLFWGLNPLWGLMILPPILFTSVLTWIAFRRGFVTERADA